MRFDYVRRQDMIRADKLTFDYERLDEEGKVESVKRAVDHVSLAIKEESL